MSTPRTTFTRWRKSHRSNGNQACVEVANTPNTIGVRDSKNPATNLEFMPGGWNALRRFCPRCSRPGAPYGSGTSRKASRSHSTTSAGGDHRSYLILWSRPGAIEAIPPTSSPSSRLRSRCW
ncbi:DUF397 domain-containing protein [Actinokineospora sp.]|uniref:DUF397 domain-containing protein n=1 Tax=Actinokineospora sp. TaxID=1872133 RepID=UPI0040376DB5